jgi:hypothetical protein
VNLFEIEHKPPQHFPFSVFHLSLRSSSRRSQ